MSDKKIADYEARIADPVQSSMGALGRWHMWVFAIILLLQFPISWNQLAIIFLAPPATISCISPSNETAACSKECHEFAYDRSIFTETIITEWDLICEKSQLANVSQTIFMLGILVGNIIFGSWADIFGRRSVLVVAVFLQLIAGVATAFTPWYWLFCVLKFLSGVSIAGIMATGFIIIMEIIGVEWRELVSVVFQLLYSLGHLTLPLFGYFIRDWHYFQFAISIPSVILISYYWLIPESPRWLYANGKIEQAAIVLEKAAKQNNLPTDNIRSDLEEAVKRKNKANVGDQGGKGNVFDLFKTPNLRTKTLCMCFNWFVCGLGFFGVAQYMGQVGGDIFINVAIGAAQGIPGAIAFFFLMKYWGRKKTLIASNTLAGVSMLCIALVPQNISWAIVMLSSAGLIGMSISFPTVYLYGCELFPTVVRNNGIGISSISARIGSMLAPFVTGLALTCSFLPPVIYGVVPLVGAVIVLWLPETKGEALPETIEDSEEFGKKSEKKNLFSNNLKF